MHGLNILLAIAAFALGSAASATLPTSGAGDPQQAEYAPDTTTDPLSAASDFTGTYKHVLGLSNAKTKQNLIFKLKQKQKASENRNVKQKSNSKIGSMKRVCCLSLSFAKVAIGNGIGNVCLPGCLGSGVQRRRQSKLTNMRTVCDVFEGSSQLRSYFHQNCGNTRGLTYA